MTKDFHYIFNYYSKILDIYRVNQYYDLNKKITIHYLKEEFFIRKFVDYERLGLSPIDTNLYNVYKYLLT